MIAPRGANPRGIVDFFTVSNPSGPLRENPPAQVSLRLRGCGNSRLLLCGRAIQPPDCASKELGAIRPKTIQGLHHRSGGGIVGTLREYGIGSASRWLGWFFLLGVLGCNTVHGQVPEYAGSDPVAPAKGKETAVLAGGCFWGVDAVFKHVKGVKDVVSGFPAATPKQQNTKWSAPDAPAMPSP